MGLGPAGALQWSLGGFLCQGGDFKSPQAGVPGLLTGCCLAVFTLFSLFGLLLFLYLCSCI